MITRFHQRIPRFQFFHDLSVLLSAGLSLLFMKGTKQKKTEKFLKKMKTFFGRTEAYLVSSFRMGLFYTLQALNLKEGDEVLLTPITIADTLNSIRLAGLKPVFVDMDPDTHSVCLKDLSLKLTDRSKVLLVTYLSGIVPDIESIKDFTRQNNLLMIEDVSQNMDALYKNQKVGSHGDVSIASLSCGKNISTLYGGLILTDDMEIMCRIRSLVSQKISAPEKQVLFYYLLSSIKVQIATSRLLFPTLVYPLLKILGKIKNQTPPDFNHDPEVKGNIFSSSIPKERKAFPDAFFVPVNDWQIQLTHHQMNQLTRATKKRRELAQVLLSNLSEKSKKYLPLKLQQQENSFYHFPIYCGGRKEELRKHLFLKGIDNGSYGLNLLHDLPAAEKIKHDSLFLPIHESYSKAQMLHIARSVNSFFDLTP